MKRPLRELKGVGEKTEKIFAKLGLTDTEELLHYFPRNYEAYDEPAEISSLKENTLCSILCNIVTSPSISPARSVQVITVTAEDSTGKISIVWYNAPYLRSTLKKGSVFVFRGRVIQKRGCLQMEHPEIFTPAAYEEIKDRLQPVYSLTAGLTNKMVTKLVKQILDSAPLSEEFLPAELRARYQLADDNFAIANIHFPMNMDELLIARKRLVFDEFLLFILAVQQLKEKTIEAQNTFMMKPVWDTEELIEGLPYELTKAQKNVWHEIERDMCSHRLMSRLVQGDVGSGKTILAFLAMILAVKNGYQAAMMVPTEVLARQHMEAFCGLAAEQGLTGCHSVLLTGSCTVKQKKEIYKSIEDGSANVIIGTHALIQDRVTYANLALVITDEQHRFGVRQREALSTRGNPPHILVMSATPIPRTLAIILYGDLDISVVDELPARRLPIKNCVVNTSYRPKAYSFMEKQIQLGHQIYIICPMVEESEGLDAENVTDYTGNIRKCFPDTVRIEALHGKMKPKEKNRIMEEFAAGAIQILVSTTVVEVGVNVPNATVMMVENAERFGLAQLHQLRGRVGRGDAQSYCIFMQGNDQQETSKRLEILNKSNDGFFIAGEDLKLRGPGDLFGIRQSGMLEFKLGDIYNDAPILKQASEAASEILTLDFDLSLEQHRPLREKLHEYMREDLQNMGL